MLNEGTKQICTSKHSGSHLTKCQRVSCYRGAIPHRCVGRHGLFFKWRAQAEYSGQWEKV